MFDSRPQLLATDFPPLRRARLTTLQVNLGYRCNLSCSHCHVNAGPLRTEMMSAATVDEVIAVLEQRSIETLDLTGGAPELNPEFRRLVVEARRRGVTVIDRCNLTILLEPDQEDLAEFLAQQQVQIVASLPCYLEENVRRQRGVQVYEDSIQALQRLNTLGYGRQPGLSLRLVYNPVGPHLPPPQAALEADYRRVLKQQFDIEFDQLLTLANMPIQRFGAVLQAQGQLASYLQLLKDNFQVANLASVMCRQLISVDWQGYLYDCDFNQMLQLPLGEGAPRHLRDLLQPLSVEDLPITVAEHCYGCTAGQGSSCAGALQ